MQLLKTDIKKQDGDSELNRKAKVEQSEAEQSKENYQITTIIGIIKPPNYQYYTFITTLLSFINRLQYLNFDNNNIFNRIIMDPDLVSLRRYILTHPLLYNSMFINILSELFKFLCSDTSDNFDNFDNFKKNNNIIKCISSNYEKNSSSKSRKKKLKILSPIKEENQING